MKTLENLLVNFNTALTVNALLCWESGKSFITSHHFSFIERFSFPDYAIHLLKALNERNFMVAIQKPSVITDFPIHQYNNFIVLDFACENSKQLLDRVM